MKKWEIESEFRVQSSEFRVEDIIKILLKNRGITTKRKVNDFLNPDLLKITPQKVKINKTQVKKALQRIKKAIDNREKIVIYGDYDVDGICGSAILWETLNSLGADVLPYIPSRFEEGYGLSVKGIENLKLKIENCSLIITVDNGIVANEAVEFANKEGIDVIITDHHIPAKKLPNALAIVHTTLVCGAAVAHLLSREISNFKFQISNKSLNTKYEILNTHLELVALATVADLVPLTHANRTLLKFGLEELRKTKRPGLLALFYKAGIKKEEIDTYEIGHIIAPRLNAMGRLENAMDSLRLVCTTNIKRAEELAKTLSETNFERQQLTQDSVSHAKNKVNDKEIKNLIFIADESYQQGIIGLIAGRLVEEYYFPSIVISKGEKYSKASARSVKGFNIIEFLRTASELLEDVGGHPMAAGFTVETTKLDLLEKKLFENAEKLLKKEHLERVLRVDCELPVNLINLETFHKFQNLAPFGMANPEPTFLTKNMLIENIRLVGNDGKHLKFNFQLPISNFQIQGIYFGGGENNQFSIGDRVDVVYTLDENIWNGNKSLQLKIKDLKSS